MGSTWRSTHAKNLRRMNIDTVFCNTLFLYFLISCCHCSSHSRRLKLPCARRSSPPRAVQHGSVGHSVWAEAEHSAARDTRPGSTPISPPPTLSIHSPASGGRGVHVWAGVGNWSSSIGVHHHKSRVKLSIPHIGDPPSSPETPDFNFVLVYK